MFLTMELPGNLSKAEEVLQCKLQALQSLRGLEKQSVVVGQYQAYASHVQEELQKGQDYVSTTPTFAGEIFLLGSEEGEGSTLEPRRAGDENPHSMILDLTADMGITSGIHKHGTWDL